MAIVANTNTTIWGGDANLYFRLAPNVVVYGGPSILQVNDSVEYIPHETTGPLGLPPLTFTSENRLIGGQLGVQVTAGGRDAGDFFVTGDLRAGFFANNIARSFQGMTDEYVGGATSRTTASLLAGNISAGFQATRNVAFTVGYQALRLNGIDLAADQAAETSDWKNPVYMVGPNLVDLLLHGATIGISIRY